MPRLSPSFSRKSRPPQSPLLALGGAQEAGARAGEAVPGRRGPRAIAQPVELRLAEGRHVWIASGRHATPESHDLIREL